MVVRVGVVASPLFYLDLVVSLFYLSLTQAKTINLKTMTLKEAHKAIDEICINQDIPMLVKWRIYDILTKHSISEFQKGLDQGVNLGKS